MGGVDRGSVTMPIVPALFCPKAWESMSGNETCRFCSYCQKEVHDLDALDVADRKALLGSGAARVCGRYRAAIRRPAHGHEVAYWRHIAKYGAGVAAAGTALVVLWEVAERDRLPREFMLGQLLGNLSVMPAHYYEESRSMVLGEIQVIGENPVFEEANSDCPFPDAPPLRRFTLTHDEVTALFAAPIPPPSVSLVGGAID